MAYKVPENLMVDGVRDLGQLGVANLSHLLVPDEFDKKKYVGRWSFVGASAERSRQQQRIQGTTIVVDGWEIWKYPEGVKGDNNEDLSGKPCVRPLGNKNAILLFRPKKLQQAVNAIHGNISRERMIAEHEGRTISGQPVQDGSMLNEKTLRRYDPTTEAAEAPNYGFNAIPAAIKPRGTRTKATTKTR